MIAAEKIHRIDEILPQVERMLRSCALCGRGCRINRLHGLMGYCKTPGDPSRVRVASHTLHFGEEPPLVGTGGSGTVFFSNCNLRCVFCQNYQISHGGMGTEISTAELADRFLSLQEQGAENINLVTPTHVICPILHALRDAYARGLSLPVVYNTNGYDSAELIKLLKGVVDIYLPDLKYMDPAASKYCSDSKNYPEVAKNAIVEMWKQVGPLRVENGVARRGMIIRHLVLPNNLAGSYEALIWLEDHGLVDATLSIMSQYAPQYRAHEFPNLNQRINPRDYNAIVEYAVKLGFEHILAQAMESSDVYFPDFKNESPFEQ
ncbi:radical SAM protein [bacterium]|nr:radical SAM protein [bacterium]